MGRIKVIELKKLKRYSDLSENKWKKIGRGKYFLSKNHSLDRNLSFENLKSIKKIMDKIGIDFWLTFGTLLGVVRDGDFISYDHDTDIAASSSDLISNFDALKESFISNGFVFRRDDDCENGLKIRVYRDKQDCCIEGFINGSLEDEEYLISKTFKFPRKYFENYGTINFKGVTFKAPYPVEDYLSFVYRDWKNPIKQEDVGAPEIWRNERVYRDTNSIIEKWRNKKIKDMGRIKIKVLCVGYRDWALKIFKDLIGIDNIDILIITSKDDIRKIIVDSINPDVILFYGWSWVVMKDIINNYLCLCLHPSLLPKYRGGTPIQNQIINGEEHGGVSIFRMTEGIDDGDICFQEKMSLDGDIQEIFDRIFKIGIEATVFLINEMKNGGIKFTQQNKQEMTFFKRRKLSQTEITIDEIQNCSSKYLYNKIRMLTDPYPNAYVICGDGKRLFITDSHIENDNGLKNKIG
jgi:methionyl-tRNA formyltransferase